MLDKQKKIVALASRRLCRTRLGCISLFPNCNGSGTLPTQPAGRRRYLSFLIAIFLLFSSSIASAQHIQIPQGELGQKIELAWSYFHDDDYEGAFEILHTLLKDNPENPLVEHTLGYLYIKDRDWDKAAKYLQDSLVHTVDEKVNLWNHIYLAEIFKQKGFLKKATGHLDFVQAHDLSMHMVKRVAKIRMDIRVMEILDSSVIMEHLLIRYPHYLLPREKVEEMGTQLVRDWKRIASFLNLSGDEKFEVFVYPSQRLMEKFYPAELNLQETDYSFDQIHTLFHGEGDYLSALAPYAYHRLCKKYNRYGASLWFIGGLDDAIRGIYNDIPLIPGQVNYTIRTNCRN